MLRLCAECGTNPVINPTRQSRCNPCLWKHYGEKQKRRLASPEGKEKLKLWRRARTFSDAVKQRERRHRAKYSGKYPEKERAKRALNREIEAGRMLRPNNCNVCGKSDRGRDGRSLIHAHHDDYSKPLEVRWLCVQCHSDHHRALKDKEP